MVRRRWPLALSAAVLLGQLLHRNPLLDVVAGTVPLDARLLANPSHVVLAPFTLAADWLNGGSRHDLFGFLGWALAVFVIARTVRALRGSAAGAPRSRAHAVLGEGVAAVVFVALVAGFVAWVAYAPRPFRRLEVDGAALVFDVHSHTRFSHDGRGWFQPFVNADWHRAGGFDAAFVTDHNRFTVPRTWPVTTPDNGPRALGGTELSLSGLHLLVLGVLDSAARGNAGQSWDSTLALIRSLSRVESRESRDSQPSTLDPRPLLIASLPEFWRHHWGPEIGDLVAAGVDGFEVWTSSPKAMEFPPAARATLVARARAQGLALVGGTDMHGLGRTPTVWNVAPLAGWGMLSDAALTERLVAEMRAGRTRVIAIDRWLPATRVDQVLSVPVNAALVLRGASRAHGAALLAWIWTVALLVSRRRPARGS